MSTIYTVLSKIHRRKFREYQRRYISPTNILLLISGFGSLLLQTLMISYQTNPRFLVSMDTTPCPLPFRTMVLKIEPFVDRVPSIRVHFALLPTNLDTNFLNIGPESFYSFQQHPQSGCSGKKTCIIIHPFATQTRDPNTYQDIMLPYTIAVYHSYCNKI